MRCFAALAPCCALALDAALSAAPQAPGRLPQGPVVRPAVPAVTDPHGFVRSPVDAFILAGLQQAGLQPAGPADRHTLLRRVTFDLTGLPPTPAEIAAFVADSAPDAYERVVERLLASPQHGVKWARHWLDLMRYAETDGYERDRQKPAVWRYRDWVVDAFNQDLPYADFVRAQLAGDELPAPKVADLVATGWYRLGIWDDEPTDPLQTRYDDLDGIADTAARVFTGVSMGCARCHDHKKDPLPTRDYYRFLAFFEGIPPYDLQARRVPVDDAPARHAAAVADFAAARERLTSALRTLAVGAAAMPPVVPPLARYDAERLAAASLPEAAGGPAGRTVGQVVAVDGYRGAGLRFDGDDEVRLPRLVAETFTVTFRVRSDRPGPGRPDERAWYGGAGLVDGETPGVVADWGVAWLADGRIVAGTGAPDTFVASGPGHHDGRWHHVAFRRDQQDGRIGLFVDGAQVAEAVGSKAPLTAPAELVLGRLATGGRGFRGDLDEIEFHARALSQAEIVAQALDLPVALAAVAAAEPNGPVAAAFTAFAALRAPELAMVDVLAVREAGPQVPPSHVRVRGNVHALGEAVEPGFPGLLGGGVPAVTPAAGGTSSGRRTALAAWITAPEHPTTWRVAVNRLWQHHFGRGLVRSSNDFGALGEAATHPELLDWLAAEFLAQGGSWKAMHRLLVTSSTYRMASTSQPAALAADPQNDRFWRFDRRRLTAEEIRDALLAATGELNLQRGGPSVFPPLPKQVLATASRPEDAWGVSPPADTVRRSLYVHSKRSLQEPLLAAFDQADTDSSCPVRFATVQATQALVLWNGDFAQRGAAALADRLAAAHADLPSQLELGLALVTQRPPRAVDRDRLLALAATLQQAHGNPARQVLERICLVLLNLNETIHLD